MKIGFIGLGSLGAPIARKIARSGFPLVVYDISPPAIEAFDEPDATPAAPGDDEPHSQRDEVGGSRRAALAVSSALALLIEHALLPPGSLAMPLPVLLSPDVAHAQEDPAADEAAVRALFAEYGRALQAQDIDRLAALYLSFSDKRREALEVYFGNTLNYEAEIVDVTVIPRGAEMAVSYTRRDRFTDRGTGKPINLEVRLTRIVVREGDTWKIRGKE